MKNSVFALALIGVAAAHPTAKREVPQEHAHQNVLDVVNTNLKLDNPDNIQDALFGLLGAKAAAEGAGNIKDPDCLQLATADQAFTNAKKAGDATGMAMALVFRALERNTGSVGLASVPCVSIKAVNPEIAALEQHQDPAAEGAQALNKKIATLLVAQIASVGGDPALANEASTFAPGEIGDPTAAGNTCDDADDAAGCINSQKLRIDDLSAAEISAAAAGAGVSSGGAGNVTANPDAAVVSNGTDTATGNTSCNLAAGGAAVDAGQKADEAAKKAKKEAKKAEKEAQKTAKNAAKKAKEQAADPAAADEKAQAGAAAGEKAQVGAAAGNKTQAGAAAGDKAQAGAAGDKNQAEAAAGDAATASGAADFGSCADPTIVFGQPSDNRQEDAFEATDLSNFPHGSALASGVITSFICDQLTNKCKANAAAVTQCDAAAAAAKPLKGQAAADAFNSGLGL